MGEIRCAICGKALSGELDTYGEVHQPLCWDCMRKLEEELKLWEALEWVPEPKEE